MNYSFFLFSKLADVCIDTNFEYDILYEYLILLFEEYENSEFNVSTQGEYECMINFFNNNK